MPSTQETLAQLRRPGLLIRAARHGMGDYERSKALHRLIDADGRATPKATFEALLKAEAVAERNRRSGHEVYSVSHHIELLVALMVEARRSLSAG